MVVGADLGFPRLHQRGGLVHGGAVAVGCAAGLVVAHVDAVVSVASGVLADLVVGRDRSRSIFRGGLFCLFCRFRGDGLRLFCERFCTCAGGGLLFGGGGLFSPEAVGNGAVKGLCFFRIFDGLVVLAKVPCIPVDRRVKAGRLICKVGRNMGGVGK